jgi:hypothetical protein
VRASHKLHAAPTHLTFSQYTIVLPAQAGLVLVRSCLCCTHKQLLGRVLVQVEHVQ